MALIGTKTVKVLLQWLKNFLRSLLQLPETLGTFKYNKLKVWSFGKYVISFCLLLERSRESEKYLLAPKTISSGSVLKETPLTRIKNIELKKPKA